MHKHYNKQNINEYELYKFSVFFHFKQEIRKELRKLDQETKKDGGVIDWNHMLNDFM